MAEHKQEIKRKFVVGLEISLKHLWGAYTFNFNSSLHYYLKWIYMFFTDSTQKQNLYQMYEKLQTVIN